MDRSLLPEPDDVVVNRVNNEWELTYYVNDQTAIRLRIQHTNREEPNDAICELRTASDQPFREVKRLDFAPIDLDPDWNEEPDLSDWPIEWRFEFVSLARVWNACTDLAEWGYALGDKQAEVEARLWPSSKTTPPNRAGETNEPGA
jgi:hypothetical protein